MCYKKLLLCFFVLTILINTLTAEQNENEITHYFLISPQNISDLPRCIEPDEPLFEYSYFEGMRKAMLGAEIVLYGLESEYISFFVL